MIVYRTLQDIEKHEQLVIKELNYRKRYFYAYIIPESGLQQFCVERVEQAFSILPWIPSRIRCPCDWWSLQTVHILDNLAPDIELHLEATVTWRSNEKTTDSLIFFLKVWLWVYNSSMFPASLLYLPKARRTEGAVRLTLTFERSVSSTSGITGVTQMSMGSTEWQIDDEKRNSLYRRIDARSIIFMSSVLISWIN